MVEDQLLTSHTVTESNNYDMRRAWDLKLTPKICNFLRCNNRYTIWSNFIKL